MMTEREKKLLAELQAKEKQDKIDARNEQKRNDRLCEKLFGMKVKEVQEKLNNTATTYSYFDEYMELKNLIERLAVAWGKPYDFFAGYVEYHEQQAEQKARTQNPWK